MSRGYDNPWRPTYEATAFVAWSAALLLLALFAVFSTLPAVPLVYPALVAIGFAALRSIQTWDNWTLKASLAGRALPVLHPQRLKKIVDRHPDELWLGKGFDWKPIHVQRLYDIRKRDPQTLLPPDFFMKMRFKVIGPPSPADVGAMWIHGVEPEEQDIFMPLANLAGNTLVLGTTGSGKTRLYDVIISQAIFRREPVIIVDPKGDADLRRLAAHACKRCGRDDDFVFFHPAFPAQSCRMDPLRNWNRPTEIASRVAALVPSETGMDAFTAFSWLTLNSIVKGLLEIEERPNIRRLRQHIQGGPEGLLERVMESWYTKHVARWESMAAPYIEKAQLERKNNRTIPMTATNRLIGMVNLYKMEVSRTQRSDTLDAMISYFDHNRDHLSKMLASLVPILELLTSGDLGDLLSPDPADPDDARPIWDTEKIISMNKVLYIGLDSLSDATVGSAIGSVMLADLASVAGATYNFGTGTPRRINLFVDEAAEVVNPPFIQILNKARGAGFSSTFASQTIADFEARLGNQAKARQLLGNANNLIALRTKDRVTQEFITETFGKIAITEIKAAHGTSSRAADSIGNFGGTVAQSRADKDAEVFPPELLGNLPNLQYMASISGGRIVKGRLPLLLEKQGEQQE